MLIYHELEDAFRARENPREHQAYWGAWQKYRGPKAESQTRRRPGCSPLPGAR